MTTVPNNGNPLIRPTVFTNKNFVLSGVTLYTDEFSVYKNSSSMTDSLANQLIGVRSSFLAIFHDGMDFH